MLSWHLLNVSLKIGDYERCEGVIGIRLWRAPEVLQALKDGMKPMFTCKTDIYSFTMVCSEILTGSLPSKVITCQTMIWFFQGKGQASSTSEQTMEEVIGKLLACRSSNAWIFWSSKEGILDLSFLNCRYMQQKLLENSVKDEGSLQGQTYIDLSEIGIGEQIAEGGQAHVHLALWKTGSRPLHLIMWKTHHSRPVVVKRFKLGWVDDVLAVAEATTESNGSGFVCWSRSRIYLQSVGCLHSRCHSVNSSRAHERGDLRNFTDLTMLSEVPLVWYIRNCTFCCQLQEGWRNCMQVDCCTKISRHWISFVGKGSEMVNQEDKSYMAEMISAYLFLSIKIGGLWELCECGGRRTNSGGHQKCCKTWEMEESPRHSHKRHNLTILCYEMIFTRDTPFQGHHPLWEEYGLVLSGKRRALAFP